MTLEWTPVVRYWELGGKEIFTQLTKIRDRGFTAVGAWVQWSHLESDRTHSLQKFLKQAKAVGLTVRLGVTPELATGFHSGGVPDDLLRDQTNLAQNRLGEPIYACAPPNIHPLVSLLAPKVFQRYGHFLLKLVQILNDVFQEGFNVETELVITDSLFKHYRSAGLTDEDFGDFSRRQGQVAEGPQGELLFQNRAVDFLKSRLMRFSHVKILKRNTYARDATLCRLMEELAGVSLNREEMFRDFMHASSRNEIAWLDDLSGLTDRERNFLLSSSMIVYGGVWCHAEDLLDCSDGFLRKIRGLADSFTASNVERDRTAAVLVGNRFAPARLADSLRNRLGNTLKIVTARQEMREQELKRLRLFAVEEGLSVSPEDADALIELARYQDCSVVVFRSSLQKQTLRKLEELRGFRLNHGWHFHLYVFPGGGHVIVVESGENANNSVEPLVDNLLSVAQIEPWCSFADETGPVKSVSYIWPKEAEARDEQRTVFVMNPSDHEISLKMKLTRTARVRGIRSGEMGDTECVGKEFSTMLPPFAVAPLAVVMDAEEAEKVESTPEVSARGEEGVVSDA